MTENAIAQARRQHDQERAVHAARLAARRRGRQGDARAARRALAQARRAA